MKKTILLLTLIILISGCSKEMEKEEVSLEQTNKKDSPIIKELSKDDNQKTMDKTQSEISFSLAIIETNFGDIKIELDEGKAPLTVANFKNYLADEFYKNTIFHRVMPGFMVQGGGFDEEGMEKETKLAIKNEATNGLNNNRGTLAMARTGVVDSATSQFFINLSDNDFLNYQSEANYGYAVFGKVIEGMEVVDKIAKVKTGLHGPHENWPEENVIIKNIKIVE